MFDQIKGIKIQINYVRYNDDALKNIEDKEDISVKFTYNDINYETKQYGIASKIEWNQDFILREVQEHLSHPLQFIIKDKDSRNDDKNIGITAKTYTVRDVAMELVRRDCEQFSKKLQVSMEAWDGKVTLAGELKLSLSWFALEDGRDVFKEHEEKKSALQQKDEHIENLETRTLRMTLVKCSYHFETSYGVDSRSPMIEFVYNDELQNASLKQGQGKFERINETYILENIKKHAEGIFQFCLRDRDFQGSRIIGKTKLLEIKDILFQIKDPKKGTGIEHVDQKYEIFDTSKNVNLAIGHLFIQFEPIDANEQLKLDEAEAERNQPKDITGKPVLFLDRPKFFNNMTM